LPYSFLALTASVLAYVVFYGRICGVSPDFQVCLNRLLTFVYSDERGLGQYGSGKTSHMISITHQELLKAIKLDKKRWVFVDHDVVVARNLLMQFRYNGKGKKKNLKFKRTDYLNNIRIIDMYEEAMRLDVPLEQRTGNWVQQYYFEADLLEQIKAQLSNPRGIWPRRIF
jgi:hypothetical protein